MNNRPGNQPAHLDGITEIITRARRIEAEERFEAVKMIGDLMEAVGSFFVIKQRAENADLDFQAYLQENRPQLSIEGIKRNKKAANIFAQLTEKDLKGILGLMDERKRDALADIKRRETRTSIFSIKGIKQFICGDPETEQQKNQVEYRHEQITEALKKKFPEVITIIKSLGFASEAV